MCFAFGRTVACAHLNTTPQRALTKRFRSCKSSAWPRARSPVGKTSLAVDELVAEVRVPVPSAGIGSAYDRHTPRKQMDIAVVGVAATLSIAGNRVERARVALGAVAPTPVRARRAEGALEGQPPSDDVFARAAEIAAMECSPIADVRASAEFRRYIVRVMTMRMLREVRDRARSG